ncbi:MAG: hypothetical protein ABJA83_09535 [Burkholderiaceae bacterium]
MKKPAPPKTIAGAAIKASGVIRPQVRDLLVRSAAYRALPPAPRREIARDTVRVASYLVDPEGLVSQEFTRPLLSANDLLAAVDFPSFVSGLIDGVFGAIVNATIEQMQAYAELMKYAAESVSNFARDKITDELARSHLLATFPQLFCRSGQHRLRAAGIALDRAARAHLSRMMGLRRTAPASASVDTLSLLVQAARRRIARERQHSLAITLAMSINRIAVNEGRAQAKRRHRSVR